MFFACYVSQAEQQNYLKPNQLNSMEKKSTCTYKRARLYPPHNNTIFWYKKKFLFINRIFFPLRLTSLCSLQTQITFNGAICLYVLFVFCHRFSSSSSSWFLVSTHIQRKRHHNFCRKKNIFVHTWRDSMHTNIQHSILLFYPTVSFLFPNSNESV